MRKQFETCLGDHSNGIDDGSDEGEDVEEVELKELLLRVRVDGGKAEHQDACQEQDGVVAGLYAI